MPRPSRLFPIAALALAGCAGSVTDPVASLDVTLSVDRTTISAPSAVQVTVQVTNRGSRPVKTAPAESYCPRAYTVEDETGQALVLTPRYCALIGYGYVELAPGESLTIRDGWSGDVADPAGASRPVGPGRYRILARVVGETGVRHSAPVTVTVIGASGG